jgi:hypothetical protein
VSWPPGQYVSDVAVIVGVGEVLMMTVFARDVVSSQWLNMVTVYAPAVVAIYELLCAPVIGVPFLFHW